MIDNSTIQRGSTGPTAAAVFIVTRVIFLESPAGGQTPAQVPKWERGAGGSAWRNQAGNGG